MAFGTVIKTWFEGRWHDGNIPIIGAADHGAWLGTMVFDGARAFEGCVPDLDLHCQRAVRSAAAMGLHAPLTAEEMIDLTLDGITRFAPGAALYIRPMLWSREGLRGMIAPDPDSTTFALCIEDLAMPDFAGQSMTVSPFRRPDPSTAMTEAKAGCLYPNNGRMLMEAQQRGFDTALSLDLEGYVAETATTNLFMVRDGHVLTPAPNGTFLNGITRQRVMALLLAEGYHVSEASLTIDDFAKADEIFVTGNAPKVLPVIRFEDRSLEIGPVTRGARQLYWDYAHDMRGAA